MKLLILINVSSLIIINNINLANKELIDSNNQDQDKW